MDLPLIECRDEEGREDLQARLVLQTCIDRRLGCIGLVFGDLRFVVEALSRGQLV